MFSKENFGGPLYHIAISKIEWSPLTWITCSGEVRPKRDDDSGGQGTGEIQMLGRVCFRRQNERWIEDEREPSQQLAANSIILNVFCVSLETVLFWAFDVSWNSKPPLFWVLSITSNPVLHDNYNFFIPGPESPIPIVNPSMDMITCKWNQGHASRPSSPTAPRTQSCWSTLVRFFSLEHTPKPFPKHCVKESVFRVWDLFFFQGMLKKTVGYKCIWCFIQESMVLPFEKNMVNKNDLRDIKDIITFVFF